MYIADCEEWVLYAYPNLPKKYYTDLVLLLGEFSPTSTIEKVQCKNIKGNFCFPFLDVLEDFPHEAYEEFQEQVYQNMMEKFNLTPYNFEC